MPFREYVSPVAHTAFDGNPVKLMLWLPWVLKFVSPPAQRRFVVPVKTLVHQAIAGIGSGKAEIRPGVSNVLYLVSRLAPGLPFSQMAKMVPASK